MFFPDACQNSYFDILIFHFHRHQRDQVNNIKTYTFYFQIMFKTVNLNLIFYNFYFVFRLMNHMDILEFIHILIDKNYFHYIKMVL